MKKTQNVDHLPASTGCAGLWPIKRVSLAEYRETYPDAVPEIRLLSDNVLIRLLDPERHFHSLIIPETAKREPYELWRGEVIAVGPGARSKRGYLTPCEVKPGDRVQFYWGAGKIGVTEYPDQKHRIIAESQIQAVLES